MSEGTGRRPSGVRGGIRQIGFLKTVARCLWDESTDEVVLVLNWPKTQDELLQAVEDLVAVRLILSHSDQPAFRLENADEVGYFFLDEEEEDKEEGERRWWRRPPTAGPHKLTLEMEPVDYRRLTGAALLLSQTREQFARGAIEDAVMKGHKGLLGYDAE